MSQFEEEEDIPLSKYRKKSPQLKNDSDLIMTTRSQKKESRSPIINGESKSNHMCENKNLTYCIKSNKQRSA